MIKAAQVLNIPIYITTQNAARLGSTVSELTSLLAAADLSSATATATTEVDKTAFSMLVPGLTEQLEAAPSGPASAGKKMSVIIVGIETHICVTQTALDLLAGGHRVYILADGVSSCNAGERPVALSRLAREGCTVTTSESLLYEVLGDAKDRNFKAIAGLVKDTKEDTKDAVETLCSRL
ncbi:hypothetical protein PV08_05655 [Exophiala spinifera]|uniref:Isochorismatase-like domain-containing protein n=1 Tax=Exophiala spinifera TaxID=91928 RepID=A0A0D1ZS38_9EURO|nr:uncharacterized protein PV08_05655 [Exophiala spinifera]KIW15607.1 hypothetical protein PV08_05655 [Exophiala spinifera]